MKGTKILAILVVAAISVSLLATVEKPDKVGKPFEAVWDALVDLQEQIDNIQLIPGPKGDKGDTGDTGPAGPEGSPGEVPAGLIVMWSGSITTIPDGWALCDGTDGTPDLSDRFIYGVSDGEDPGDTGGSATHSHSYSDLPKHSHGVTDPGHTHKVNVQSASGTGMNKVEYSQCATETRLGGSLTVNHSGVTINESGKASCSTDAANGLPPYYKLAFIMKL